MDLHPRVVRLMKSSGYGKSFVLAFGHVGPEAAWLLGGVGSSAKVPLVPAHPSSDL